MYIYEHKIVCIDDKFSKPKKNIKLRMQFENLLLKFLKKLSIVERL